ncbi:putative enzymatic polyprotein [Sesamum angolense]|uniref:Enzymatic polyprotein n=1 Tax=Sesamum angolense TaxID=2727404 RepID=A0AAE2BS63_9LAMI|nr:putative enzymatic polyprotein [Sesamum angolense]
MNISIGFKYFFQSGVAVEQPPMFFQNLQSMEGNVDPIIQSTSGQMDSVAEECLPQRQIEGLVFIKHPSRKHEKAERTDTRSKKNPYEKNFQTGPTRANEVSKTDAMLTCGARGHIAPDCPQKRGEIRKFEATNDILDAVYYGIGREKWKYDFGISLLEDHKHGEKRERKGFSQKILILNTGIREAKIMIRGAFGTPWFRQRGDVVNCKLTHPKMQDKRKFGKVLLSFRQQGLIDSDSFYDESNEEIKNLKEAMQELKTMDISEESQLSLENVKRLIQRNFSENPLAWWDRNKIEATLKIKEECKYEYVRYKPIQMNMEDMKDMQMIIKEHINLGLIEPGISAYSSPGFLIKMESESKKFTAFSTPQGQYIWNILPMGLANATQIFQRKMDNLFKDYFEFMFVYIDDILIASKNMKKHVKHLEIFSDACYKEGLVLSEKKATIAVNKIEFLGILIDETGIELQEHIVEKIHNFPDILKDKKHLQSFLGVVCNNLPKLAILQDEDELVVYTDANDYRWAAVLMKKNTTGKEPCRYTGGLFTEQQARVWHINEKEFFAIHKNDMVVSTHYGTIARAIRASSSEMTNELRKHDAKHALRVQDSRHVAADSSTACTRPSPDSGVTATNESQGVQTSDDSSQPSASGGKALNLQKVCRERDAHMENKLPATEVKDEDM